MRKQPASPKEGPEIVAHRGDAERFPENTLPALAAALDYGLGWVEFDVQLSADLVPWVVHDAQLERTTGLPGVLLNLDSQTLDRIEACEPARFGERHRGTALPRLSAVAELLGRHPRARAFVELKRASLFHHGHEACLTRVLQELQPIASQSILISFDADACRMARDMGGLPVGWVFDGAPAEHLAIAEALQPEYLFCDQQALLPGEMLPPGPWRWAAYEVTTAAEARSLHARGVALVESMAPRRLAEALAGSEAEA